MIQIDRVERFEHFFRRERFPRNDGWFEAVPSNDGRRFRPPADDRRVSQARDEVVEAAAPFRLAQQRRRSCAGLKNDDAEPARCQLIHKCRRFGLAGHFSH